MLDMNLVDMYIPRQMYRPNLADTQCVVTEIHVIIKIYQFLP